MAYGLRIRGMKRLEIKGRVDRVLEFVGLTHKKNQDALTLSSGETQRLGIARAMVFRLIPDYGAQNKFLATKKSLHFLPCFC